MKKTLIAAAVMAASGVAFAASNVTLYGVIEEGVMVQKAKDTAASVELKAGFDSGNRWGIKGVEDLGNGYSVGFILEQGFFADDGSSYTERDVEDANEKKSLAFGRESILYVNGAFGSLAFGRTGGLAFAQSRNIRTGWVFGTGYGTAAWNAIDSVAKRMNNVISYATPVFDGFSIHAMYSNSGTNALGSDTAKWSKNGHYYGLGVKYQANAIRSSLIFEAVDNKATGTDAVKVSDLFTENEFKALGIGDDWAANKDTVIKEATGKKKAIYTINYGLEYNLGSWTPMFAYQFAHQNSGRRTHMFGLSAKVAVGGGDVLVGGRYLFGKDEAKDVGANKVAVDGDVRAWNIGAAYIYPLSKRTAVKAYAGYADGAKAWKDTEKVVYNGYQVYLGLRHAF